MKRERWSVKRRQIWRLLTEDERLTLREIKVRCGLYGDSSVRFHLEKLRADGIITWSPRCARSIRVLRPYRDDVLE